MSSDPGPATTPSTARVGIVLSATLACIIGPIAYLALVAEPHPAPAVHALRQMVVGRGTCPVGCDCFGAKGLERISASGKHEWFDGQCWTTTPQPPLDTPAGQYRPIPPAPKLVR